MSGGATLTCARDGTSTQLTCTRCAAPICPLCLVRTDVGLRCPACADAPSSSSPPSRTRVLVAGGVVALAVIVVATMLVARGVGSHSDTGQQAAASVQRIDRPDLGFSLDLPGSWVVDVDQTPGSVFYAHSVPPKSSARIFRGQTQQSLEDNMTNLVDGLRQQGAHDFAQHAVDVGGAPGIRLDYLAADGPAGTTAAHSAYRVKKGDGLFSLSLATTDPSADNDVLSTIASSFRLL